MTDAATPSTAADFEHHVGETFVADVSGRSCTLVLAAVDRGPEQPGAPRPDPFSLLFTGSPDEPFAQGTRSLAHPDVGTFELFLVPRQPLVDGLARYEAVFN